MTQPEPVFSEPWHAQVFAVTVRLNETGHLPWTNWAAAFSKTLKRHGLARDLDGGDDYFLAWLATLEEILIANGLAQGAEIAEIKSRWEAAYLSTPHGQPVRLA